MHQTTATFERIFDVVRDSMSSDRQPCTFFSFQQGGIRKCGIAAPGSPELTDGMTVTAILRESNNWQTLIGWLNHSTGEIVCKNQSALIAAVAICIASFAVAFKVASASYALASIPPTMAVLYLVPCIRSARQINAARRTLEALMQAGRMDV